jgi:hypothetical protein
MQHKLRLGIFGCIILSAIVYLCVDFSSENAGFAPGLQPVLSAAFDYRREAKFESLKERLQPESYDDKAHGGLMGFPWKERQSIEFQRQLSQPRSRGDQYGPFEATWTERGPLGIPGRVTGSVVVHEKEKIYLLTDGGYLYSGGLNGSNWTCLNNERPVARGVDARLEMVVLPGGGIRLFVGGWDAAFVGVGYLMYSDDEGKSWKAPQGLSPGAWYRRTQAKTGGLVWHLMRVDDPTNGAQMVLYRSLDYGQSFEPVYVHPLSVPWFDRCCDFWADADKAFCVFEGQTVQVAADGQKTTLGKVSDTPAPEWAILTGGRAHPQDPYTFYCRIWNGAENKIYKSADGGSTWSPWGQLVEGGLLWPFSNYAFATNPENPDRVYSGGWILGVSSDGQDWHYPHDLGGYVGYHGDVPDLNFTKNPLTGTMELYLGTDGGFYRYSAAEDTFASLTLKGLGNTQIYRMASNHQEPHRMYIGTQDNGFCFNNAPFSGAGQADFEYLWGGDVTQVVSGDRGKSFWCFWWGLGCNYVADATNIAASGIANWGPIYDSEYWEIPAKADPWEPDACLVAGYVSPAPEGSYLVRLKAPDGLAPGTLLPLEQSYGTFDFKEASGGGRIGAIEISPLNNQHIYVMTDNGVFFWSLDRGQTWQMNDEAAGKIWVRFISASPTVEGELFVGGAGYGENTPCWRLSLHGQIMQPAEPVQQSSLRDNRVNGLCFDDTGKFVFAAADIGAFVYDTDTGTWQRISYAPAPMSGYHDVEYLRNSRTARFATYARGVWDFTLETPSAAATLATRLSHLKVFPTLATERVVLELQAEDGASATLRVFSSNGQLQTEKRLTANAPLALPVADWKPGIYYYSLQGEGKNYGGGRLVRQ